MAVFNVSFANTKTKALGKDYGYLVDQLDIMESQLQSDGKLSPGDYDLLSKRAQQIYAYPGLTPAQRSNIEVKIASYGSKKSRDVIHDQNDIARLNRELEDDARKSSMLLGNNPTAYLQAQVALQDARVSRLADAIDNLDGSGDDSSAAINEYNTALQDYQDALEALDVAQKHQLGGAPKSGFAAYITTNNSGEITDVKIKREGTQSGYLETNGLYGGMKIYGKLNRKENGQNLFVLGNDTYRGNDFISLGSDGSMRSAPLLSSRTTQGKNFGAVQFAKSYVDMDAATTKTQSAIRAGGWVEGSDGFLYQKGTDGKYTKYVNVSKDQLNVRDSDIIKVPRSMEQSIVPMVTKTIDSAPAPKLPQPTTADMSMGPAAAPAEQKPRLPGLGGGPVQPTPTAGSRIKDIAAGAMKSAGSYLGKLFGGGQ